MLPGKLSLSLNPISMQTLKQILFRKENIVYYLPFLAFIWYLVRFHLAGPFYLSRIDPEYPYLLNGLNIAIIDFSRIGHVDHPGTPFQFLTAFFIRLTHLFAGQTNIIDDVISRPEFYLSWSTFYLSCITFLILIWLGKITYKLTKDLTGSIILQSSIFLNVILIDIPSRYIPDRLLILLVLILVGLIVKKYHDNSYTYKKFAIQSGIVLGVGFVTKFNFLPLLLIPFIIISYRKERLVYLGSLFSTIVLCFLPILKKFSAYKSFILRILKHDQLYGYGQEQLINVESFFKNLGKLFTTNGTFIFLILILLVFIVIIARNKTREKYNIELRILVAIFITALISSLIVAKHYKNYYVLPMVSLGGLVFYMNYMITNRLASSKWIKPLTISILVVFYLFQLKELIPAYARISLQRGNNTRTSLFIKNTITANDYFFVYPTWRSGAFLENGLIYGISYVSHHPLYYKTIEKYYPNILTWEGNDRPMMFFRMIDSDTETIMKSGKNIYIYSTPGRNAKMLCKYIEVAANQYQISLVHDTVYSNSINSEYIICYSHADNWGELQNARCGFEKISDNNIYTDNGTLQLFGLAKVEEKMKVNGDHAIVLNAIQNETPAYQIKNLHPGDILEFSIKGYSKSNKDQDNLSLVVKNIQGEVTDSFPVHATNTSREIIRGCRIRRITCSVPNIKVDSFYYASFKYEGNTEIVLDDFSYSHFGERICGNISTLQ